MKEYIVKINHPYTKNMQEFIRRKDCRYFIGEGHYCKIRGMGRALKEDDFCSDGKRHEGR